MRKATRNAQGSGTIRQRKNGTWEARYTIGRDPGTGRQRQKSVYGKTQAEVAQKMRKATHELDEGIYMEPSKMTVEAWFKIWFDEYLGSVKPNTQEQYRYQERVHIRPALGVVKLTALTTPMIQKLYNDAIRKGLSPKSVRNMHGVLHKCLHQAMKLQYIRFNPCDACELPRVERQEIRPIEGDAIKAFLNAIKDDPFEDLLFVTIFTGMRQGEVLGLTWDAVDFVKGTITISKQLQKERLQGGGGQYRFVPLKNDKQRTVTPAPAVMTVLRSVQRKQKAARLRHGGAWSNPLNLVFTNELGEHLSKNTVYSHCKSVVAKIGMPSTRFHDLRHTFATLSLQNGDDIKTVSASLGHATVAFTLDVYGHVTEKMKQDSADRMQAFIDAAKA